MLIPFLLTTYLRIQLCDLYEFQDPRTGHGMTDQYPYADHVLVGNGTPSYHIRKFHTIWLMTASSARSKRREFGNL
jgi:hypothetical protein